MVKRGLSEDVVDNLISNKQQKQADANNLIYWKDGWIQHIHSVGELV